MKKKNPKIVYDERSKVLSLKIGKGKSVDSDIQGNVVLDYDKKGKIVCISLYEFNFNEFKENRRALRSFVRNSKSVLVDRLGIRN